MVRSKPAPALEQFGRLQAAADLFNRELFAGSLPPVFITMVNKPGCWGFFSPNRYRGRDGQLLDQIALDATTAIERPLPELLSTLVHEQCHQAIYEQGGRQTIPGHNAAWRGLMLGLGLPPVRIGTTWRQATHRIEPSGPFMQVVQAHAAELQELPWQEASRAATRSKGTGSDRVRFQCPSCGGNAWARPSAELLCGTCSTVAQLVAMLPDVRPSSGSRTTPGSDGEYNEPTRVPGLPVFTTELARELRLHTGLDHPPTSNAEALVVLTFGMTERGHGELIEALGGAEGDALVVALRKVWKVRARQLHPDAGGSEVAFKSLQAAFMMLKPPGRK